MRQVANALVQMDPTLPEKGTAAFVVSKRATSIVMAACVYRLMSHHNTPCIILSEQRPQPQQLQEIARPRGASIRLCTSVDESVFMLPCLCWVFFFFYHRYRSSIELLCRWRLRRVIFFFHTTPSQVYSTYLNRICNPANSLPNRSGCYQSQSTATQCLSGPIKTNQGC